MRNYRQAHTAVPHSQSAESRKGEGTSLHIVSMFSTVVRRFAHFARLFPEFSELPSEVSLFSLYFYELIYFLASSSLYSKRERERKRGESSIAVIFMK